jgi:hypothetical protein
MLEDIKKDGQMEEKFDGGETGRYTYEVKATV